MVIDPYFKLFFEKCVFNNINIYIVSGGLKKIICNYLPYFNSKNIYANDIEFGPPNKIKLLLKCNCEHK